MNEIIQIDSSGKITARELYEFLELTRGQFARWVKQHIVDNQFAEDGKDYEGFDIVVEGNSTKDYKLTIDFAKKLCMVSKSLKGEQARNYFIEVEKRYLVSVSSFMIEDPIKRAERWIEEQKEKQSLQLENAQSKQIINELQPKATYYDLVLQNKTLLSMTRIAKDYGMSAIALNNMLHELGVQFKQCDVWLLYQKYADKGYTQSKTHVLDDERNKFHTYWTQKGRLFIYDLLKSKNGILPLIEREV